MKKTYVTAFFISISISLLAQSISPAVYDSSTSSYYYSFGDVKTTDTVDQEFIMSGMREGESFSVSVDEQDLESNYSSFCGEDLTQDPNFLVLKGESGSITKKSGAFTIRFNPRPFYYTEEYEATWGLNCQGTVSPSLGDKSATVTVSLEKSGQMTIGISGKSTAIVTALPNDTRPSQKILSLAFPSPTESTLYLSQMATIYDSFGNVMMPSHQGSVDISAFPSGIYLVKSQDQSQKIIKK